jgi:N-glycosylase/DNA lyase
MTRQLTIQQPFNLKLTLTMGQAFRWRPLPSEFYGDGWFSGVLRENLIHIRQTDAGVEYRVGGADGELGDVGFDWDVQICRYFRMDTDNIRGIYDDLCRDQKVATVIWRYSGLRLLRQDPWECLVSYICSRANSVENISENVETITTLSGRAVSIGDEKRHLFPSAAEVLEAGGDTLSRLDMKGLRHPAPAMLSAAKRVVAGDLDLDELKQYGHRYETVIDELRKIDGVGYKIANCVALFGLNRVEAFPCDRWVMRAMADWYDDFPTPTRPGSPSAKDHQAIADWSQQRFGPFAGYAGQFLFHGRRQEEAESKLPFWERESKSAVVPHHDDPLWVAIARKHLS